MDRKTTPNKFSVSRKNIIYRLDQSLKKLQTSYVDLFYVHKYDSEIPLEETMTTLDSLVKQGKIRYIACSNYTKRATCRIPRVSQIELELRISLLFKTNTILLIERWRTM